MLLLHHCNTEGLRESEVQLQPHEVGRPHSHLMFLLHFYFLLSKSCSVRLYLIVSVTILAKNCYRVVESILINIYASIRQVMERCIVGVITRCKKTDFRADHERMRCSGLYAKLHQTLIEDHKSPLRRCVFMEMHSQWCMDITYCKHNYLHELSSIKAGTITDTLKAGKRKQLTQYNK